MPDQLGVPPSDGDGLSLGVVGRSVGVGVGVTGAVSVGDGVTLLVGSGIVGPVELSAGFGVSDSDGVGVGWVGWVGGVDVAGADVGRCGCVVGRLGGGVVGAVVGCRCCVAGLVGAVVVGDVDAEDVVLGLVEVVGP